MTAYVVAYGRDPDDNFRVLSYPTRAAAHHGAARQPVGDCALVIETERDATALNVNLLLCVYNRVTGGETRRFESATVGASRLLAALAAAYPAPKNEETMSEAKNGRVNKDDVIMVLVESNPKRVGSKSYERFGLYRNGMTVAEAIGAGIPTTDISYDKSHNYISVNPAP